MIPAALYAILATVHLGAIHAIVFGGFASNALAQRIEAARPRAVVTASCGIEGAKGPISYQAFVQEAQAKSTFKPEFVLIWQREQLRWTDLDTSKGERDWRKLVDDARRRGSRVAAVPVRSDEGLYIIYTSGKTLSFLSFGTLPMHRIGERYPVIAYTVQPPRAHQRAYFELQQDMRLVSILRSSMSLE